MSNPNDNELFCATRAMYHYARGVSYASLNSVVEARRELKLLEGIMGIEAKKEVSEI